MGGKLWIKNMRIYKPKDSNVVTVEASTSLLIMYNPHVGEGNVVFKNSRILRPCTPSNLFLSEGSITISAPSYDKLSFIFNDDTPSYAYVVFIGW